MKRLKIFYKFFIDLCEYSSKFISRSSKLWKHKLHIIFLMRILKKRINVFKMNQMGLTISKENTINKCNGFFGNIYKLH